MKIRHILTAMLALAAVSCEQANLENNEPVSDNMLKVRFATPDIEVKSGSEDVTFYAYIPDELKAGTVAPIAATIKKDDGYLYYNIPEGTTEVIFSNISGNENEHVMFTNDSYGNIKISLKNLESHSHIYHDDILIGRLTDFTTGSSEVYNIDIQRLSSNVTTNLTVIDTEGNILSNDYISSASIWYYGFAQSLTLTDDLYSMTGDTPEGATYSGWSMTKTEDNVMTNTHSFIPSSLEPRIEVSITDLSENYKQYSTVLSGIAFEPNHHYTVNLRLKQLNVEGTFVLEEPTVTTSSKNPSYSEQEFFTLSEGRTVGGFADDVLTIDVSTALPYDWYIVYPEDAQAFFDIQVIDGQIVIRALATNENDIRSVDIELKTDEGYTKTITINQKSSLKHRIVMTSEHTYGSSTFYISGVNMTVQDPNDTEPRTINDGENVNVSIDGLTKGSQVIIEGDIITYLGSFNSTNYTDNYGYKYEYYDNTLRCYYFSNSSSRSFSYSFTNCLYLENLVIHGQKEALDLSGLKSLKRIHLQYATCACPTFAAGQPLEHFTAYDCDALGTLDLRNLSSTIKHINCALSDNIGTINFTNFSALESVNVNSCTGANMINLTGCSSLEYFDVYNNSASALKINNCSALKELSLRSMSLSTITHEGADALETISTNSSTVTTLDFNNKFSLITVGSLSCTTLNLNNCANLTSLGTMNNVVSFDISNCTSLESANISLSTGSSDQTGSFNNCPVLKTLTISNLRSTLDFSPITSVEDITIKEMRGNSLSSIDLSNLTQLKNAYIDGYDSSLPLNEIKLPANIETLTLEYLYNMESIDFSNLTNLKSVDFKELYYSKSISLANCIALENFEIRYCFFYNSGTLDLTGCQSLKSINQKYAGERQSNRYIQSVSLTGCSALEEFYMYEGQLSSLDFTDCQMMKKLDIRSNYMTVEAIDAMFVTLPDRSDEWESGAYQISVSGFDVAAANAKNWYAIN